MQKIENYIGGELTVPKSGEYLDNYDPSTGQVYSQIADSDDRDVQMAVDAANADVAAAASAVMATSVGIPNVLWFIQLPS